MPDGLCEYQYWEHDCERVAAVRVWSDVNQRWVYGCHVIALALHDGPASTLLEMAQ